MHLGRNIAYERMNAICVSQSVIHQVLNVSNGVFKRKRLRKNNISLKKDKSCVIK